jgi:hypothetical protein
MTTPPVPDRLAEIVAEAAARLEAAGEAVTPEAVLHGTAHMTLVDLFEVIVP